MKEGTTENEQIIGDITAAWPCLKTLPDEVKSVREQVSATADELKRLRRGLVMSPSVAPARAPILLLGETGVGKELVARALHAAGNDSAGPFVALNCAGLSRDLLASELFGYADGAFTGARKGGAAGKIEAAHGGTLFLDEIGEMPIELQGHLLRALEQGEIYRVGDNQPRKVQFRLISATNRELRDEVAAGRFRMDLYYRVAVTSLRIPPLRDRPEDVGDLAEHYLQVFADERRAGPRRLSPEASAALQAYRWPGNVRELRNVIERAVILESGGTLSPDSVLLRGPPPPRLAGEAEDDGAAPPPSLDEVEKAYVERLLARAKGNKSQVARWMGVSYPTVVKKIADHGIDTSRWKDG